ncbi:MAG TPA: hypothetical protein VNA04_17610, partial [Thermoanaerobaculia bacterium]|nr:hypothetical protein [Thermoanaerobaculia bacterium]
MSKPAVYRRIHHFLIGVAALVVVYASSPGMTPQETSAPPLRPAATAAACSDELVLLDHDVLYDVVVEGTAPAPSGSRQFCPDSPGFETFSVDLAPDGNWYGVFAENCTGAAVWGRIDPDVPASGATAPGLIPLGPIPYTMNLWPLRARPAFVPEPEPGSPIAYRIGERPPGPNTTCGRGRSSGLGDCGMDIYAIDSLSPYRERMLTTDVLSNSNYPFGTAVIVGSGSGSQESRTNVMFVTTDAVYCWGTGPVCSVTGA